MKTNQHTPEQIIKILDQAVAGEQSVAAVCRQHGIAETTFYRWRKAYGGMSVNEAQLWCLPTPSAPVAPHSHPLTRRVYTRDGDRPKPERARPCPWRQASDLRHPPLPEYAD